MSGLKPQWKAWGFQTWAGLQYSVWSSKFNHCWDCCTDRRGSLKPKNAKIQEFQVNLIWCWCKSCSLEKKKEGERKEKRREKKPMLLQILLDIFRVELQQPSHIWMWVWPSKLALPPEYCLHSLARRKSQSRSELHRFTLVVSYMSSARFSSATVLWGGATAEGDQNR